MVSFSPEWFQWIKGHSEYTDFTDDYMRGEGIRRDHGNR